MSNLISAFVHCNTATAPSLLTQREGKVKAKHSIFRITPEISPYSGEATGRTIGMEDQARDYDTMVSRAEILMTMRISRRDEGEGSIIISRESSLSLLFAIGEHRRLRFYEVAYKVRHTCA